KSKVELLRFSYGEFFEDVIRSVDVLSVLPDGLQFDNLLTLIERRIGRIDELTASEPALKSESLFGIGGKHSEPETFASFGIINDSLIKPAHREKPAF